jgi:MFS family permease
MGFVQTHSIAFGIEAGHSHLMLAGVMGVMGALSVVGGLLLGGLSDRIGRRDPLALAYLLRGIGLLMWLAVPFGNGAVPLYAGVVAIGLSWAATTSLTTASCADVWGSRSAGAIAGLSLFIMWMGHAAGTWAPGLLAASGHGYVPALILNAGASLAAAAAVFGSRHPRLLCAPARG